MRARLAFSEERRITLLGKWMYLETTVNSRLSLSRLTILSTRLGSMRDTWQPGSCHEVGRMIVIVDTPLENLPPHPCKAKRVQMEEV